MKIGTWVAAKRGEGMSRFSILDTEQVQNLPVVAKMPAAIFFLFFLPFFFVLQQEEVRNESQRGIRER